MFSFWKRKENKSEPAGAAKKYRPVVLLVLDGVGVNTALSDSTWKHAQMPTFRNLEKYYPFTTLQASGIAVGLPWGEEGNSEVGHLTMGAGKTLHHHFPRVIMSIYDKTFFKNPAFLGAADFIKTTGGKLQIMGLITSGSVHAYIDHLYALLDFAKLAGVNQVYLHLFTDGRDSATKEGAMLLSQLEERIKSEYPFAKIATISGRFFAMDRDENWDRIKKIYECMTREQASCKNFMTASEYISQNYQVGITDEFIEPARLEIQPTPIIQAGDAVIFYNFREDSVRELTSAFVSDDFKGFPREKISNLYFVTMTEYSRNFPVKVAFPPLDITNPLAKIISDAGLKQFHVAETEKYAHVTYFFNGGKENPFVGEERLLISSQHAMRFDEIPAMSADKITEAVLNGLQKYDFILANFANGDMVGHTGNFDATVKALEVLDIAVGKISWAVLQKDGALVVTGDHGNAEEKIYTTSGEKRTKHTANPVPIFVIAKELKSNKPKTDAEILTDYNQTKGVLTDVAPTVLALLDLPKAPEMTGVNLLEKVLKQ